MIKALQISIDKTSLKDEGDTKAVATWIKSFDKLLEFHNVFPVTWEATENDGKLVFTAWIPPDCLVDFEEAADEISEVYGDFDARDSEDWPT